MHDGVASFCSQTTIPKLLHHDYDAKLSSTNQLVTKIITQPPLYTHPSFMPPHTHHRQCLVPTGLCVCVLPSYLQRNAQTHPCLAITSFRPMQCLRAYSPCCAGVVRLPSACRSLAHCCSTFTLIIFADFSLATASSRPTRALSIAQLAIRTELIKGRQPRSPLPRLLHKLFSETATCGILSGVGMGQEHVL